MIRRPQNLWNDTSARIPFSLFGIFILLGSSITTVFLYDQGVKERDDQIQIIGNQQVEHLISEVEADISSMLNHISLTQLYTIGLNPVVIPTDPSLSAEEINVYRLKKAIINEYWIQLVSYGPMKKGCEDCGINPAAYPADDLFLAHSTAQLV